ncbi:MAG: hypothetical protein Q9227_004381 [Pyrenula ochraceoflavens]
MRKTIAVNLEDIGSESVEKLISRIQGASSTVEKKKATDVLLEKFHRLESGKEHVNNDSSQLQEEFTTSRPDLSQQLRALQEKHQISVEAKELEIQDMKKTKAREMKDLHTDYDVAITAIDKKWAQVQEKLKDSIASKDMENESLRKDLASLHRKREASVDGRRVVAKRIKKEE